MSQSEIERFVSDLNSHDGLLADAEQFQASESQAKLLEALVSFTTSKDYSTTAEDVTAFVQARATVAGNSNKLSDAELASVLGAGEPDPLNVSQCHLIDIYRPDGANTDRADPRQLHL